MSVRNIYLVYYNISNDKNFDLIFDNFLNNIYNPHTTLKFNSGIDEELLHNFVEEDITVDVNVNNYKRFFRIKSELKNIIIFDESDRLFPIFDPDDYGFASSLPDDILNNHHRFNNLYLVSTNKEHLNKIAKLVRDGYKQQFKNKELNIYKINVLKAHLNNSQ